MQGTLHPHKTWKSLWIAAEEVWQVLDGIQGFCAAQKMIYMTIDL
jgi:hypothetical protein